MTRWRITWAIILLVVIGLPVFMPVADLLADWQGWSAWSEGERLGSLLTNTIKLVAFTLAVVLPAGIGGAVLLYRTDLPMRRGLRFLNLLTLFVPLPLFVSAWQAALGTGGWLPVTLWTNAEPGDPDVSPAGIAFKPWGHGLATAVFVHAVAALPWVIVLVGQGLRWVERELEEDALLAAGPWRVFWSVTLPRCRAAVVAAALWVGLMIVTEITVTDMMQVRTFAEEVYTQLVLGNDEALARAVAVSLPLILVVACLVVAGSLRWERTLPPLESVERPPYELALGLTRWPCLILVLLLIGILAGVPVVSLIWKAGLSGDPQAWSAQVVRVHLAKEFHVRGEMIALSLVVAAGSGLLTSTLALLLCWLATGARWFHALSLGLMAVVWAMPGPVLGIGMKEAINYLLKLIPVEPLEVALYRGPSPLPNLWVNVVRFFPCAVAVLWPVVRLIPVSLRDAARVDGATPGQEFRHIILPLALPACLRAGFAVMVLALGELGAGKLVATPGSMTFAQEVFVQMHYGVSNDLAALCLILLALVACGGALFAMVNGWLRAWGRGLDR
jgi:iron(III) transport system permease protein